MGERAVDLEKAVEARSAVELVLGEVGVDVDVGQMQIARHRRPRKAQRREDPERQRTGAGQGGDGDSRAPREPTQKSGSAITGPGTGVSDASRGSPAGGPAYG